MNSIRWFFCLFVCQSINFLTQGNIFGFTWNWFMLLIVFIKFSILKMEYVSVIFPLQGHSKEPHYITFYWNKSFSAYFTGFRTSNAVWWIIVEIKMCIYMWGTVQNTLFWICVYSIKVYLQGHCKHFVRLRSLWKNRRKLFLLCYSKHSEIFLCLWSALLDT